ncbi:hypothetical protein SMD27_16310 [Dongia soli]|uniref:Methyl-accepting chemotaxis protein n=1 Tax=Dongia soli TaxID=600628 RepID=A0ABU5EDW8_9PROT|nr:hypothetical protein [Dongia soli]MDY0884408.1 hypothetical protein [Dongia soli]
MTSSRVLDEALLPPKTASTLIEGTFVDIGGRLEGAMEILDRLGATFTRLQHELESEDLRTATRDMGKVAERISALANTSDDALEVLKGIAGMATAIDGRISQMRKAIKAVDVLAVNAKIAAAHISAAGEEFASFADEIGGALKVAQLNLDNFSQELAQLADIVRSAVTEQGSLRQRQAEAAFTVPRALSQSVDTIAARRQQAATTAASIQRKSAEVGRQIGVAVMALQIGDTTRQRIEHVEYAIGICKNFDKPDLIRQHIPNLAKLSNSERDLLIAAGCQLQDEQLLDTAKELDRLSCADGRRSARFKMSRGRPELGGIKARGVLRRAALLRKAISNWTRLRSASPKSEQSISIRPAAERAPRISVCTTSIFRMVTAFGNRMQIALCCCARSSITSYNRCPPTLDSNVIIKE